MNDHCLKYDPTTYHTTVFQNCHSINLMSEVYFKSYGRKKNIHQCHLVSRGYTDMIFKYCYSRTNGKRHVNNKIENKLSKIKLIIENENF